MPKFMGMPLYGLKDYKEEKLKEDLTEEEVFYMNGLGARRTSMASMNNVTGLKGRSSLMDVKGTGQGRARSRSQSKSRLGSRSLDGVSKNKLNHINPVHF